MFFPNQYKIIAEGPKKIYSYKFNDKTILIHHIAGVVTNALVVKIGYLLLCFTSEASVLKTKSLINQLKFTIGYYFLCLTIGWLISWIISFIPYHEWADFGFKESGKYIFNDEFNNYSFSYETIIGGGQPMHWEVIYKVIIIATISSFIGWLTWLLYSTCILGGVSKISQRKQDLVVLSEMTEIKHNGNKIKHFDI